MVLTFKHLTVAGSSHSDIYETCVECNLGQKIRLLIGNQMVRKSNGLDF